MFHLWPKQSRESASVRTLDLRPDACWIVFGRLALLLVALASVSYRSYFGDQASAEGVAFLYQPLWVLIGVTLASVSALRWFRLWHGFFFLQLGIDVAMVTGVIYITGGPASPFLFLYLPLVMIAAIFLTRWHALTLGLAAAAAYVSLAFCMVSRLLAPADGSSIVHMPAGGITLQCIGLSSALVLIAIATSFLRRNIRAGFQLAEQSEESLQRLSKEQAELRSYVKEIEEQVALQERMADLFSQPEETANFTYSHFIGQSKLMEQVFRLIQKVSCSQATVMISGESGTGKELAARSIHEGSERAREAFVAVNCGAIPESLLESELFGHKKGAFTGAESDHTGLFRKADRGTLFLDEIGELPLLMQAKLLRVIQERQVRPVGSDISFPIDVRIVAASNRNLAKEVKEGRFREDLYYRLNVIHVQLPALRERQEDIPLLVRNIVSKLRGSDAEVHITPSALQSLMSYSYPGNVRELENIIERALVFGGDAIRLEDLPAEVLGKSNAKATQHEHVEVDTLELKRETEILTTEGDLEFPVQLDEILNTIEKRYLEAALAESRGIKKKAAVLLGMNFRSLRYRLQKYGLQEESGDEK